MNKKAISKYSRWLHIYLSMISFVIVLFFSITGLTLNHADYFQSNTSITQNEGNINKSWVNSPDTLGIKKLEIVEFFRNTYKVKGAVDNFSIYDNEVSVTFKAPGYAADAFINRSDASFSLMQTNQGLMGFFNDLHKGRDSGKAWLWVIDISAILMTLISLTGLILLLFIKKKRSAGLILLFIGFVLTYIVYYFWGQ